MLTLELECDMTEIVVDDTFSIVIEDDYWNHARSRKSYTAWFVQDNIPTGMIRYLTGGNDGEVTTLCDIEVRSEYRGSNRGVTFIRALEEHVIGGTLYTTGHYTPEGFRSLSEALPLVPGAYPDEAGIHFRSMSFVEDWDTFSTN